MSSALLRAVGGGGRLHATGLPWQEGKPQDRTADAFVSKILCSRHNTALSTLDPVAARLFEVLHSLHPAQIATADAIADKCVYVMNGHDLERWCVKAMLGLLFSGNMNLHARSLKGIPPRRDLLEFLFGDRPQLPRWRLHISSPSQLPPPHERHVAVTPLTIDGELAGISVQLAGLEFAFASSEGQFPRPQQTAERPTELHIKTESGLRIIAVSWEHPGSNRPVVLEQRPVDPSGDPGSEPGDAPTEPTTTS